jgi:hypothetical protein
MPNDVSQAVVRIMIGGLRRRAVLMSELYVRYSTLGNESSVSIGRQPHSCKVVTTGSGGAH